MSRSVRNNLLRARRAVSLLEVLVALAIVLVLMAVALPWSFEWLGGRELDNAEDRLAMQLMMARAAAREEGRPIEVVAHTGGDFSSVSARWMRLDGARDDATESRATAGDLENVVFGAQPADGESWTSINADWAQFELPQGIRIALEGKTEATSDEAELGGRSRDSDEFADSGDDSAAAQTQTLAIFLPDGTVIVAPIFMLQMEGGAARAMRVDRSTGRPRNIEAGAAASKGPTVRPDFDTAEFAGDEDAAERLSDD